MQEVSKMPPQFVTVKIFDDVIRTKQLHSHHSEYEDDNCQYEAQIAKSTHCPTNNTN
jgi:hypothetical protein